jgi:selenocysteine lyase/cysteine desulfurase
MTPEEFRQQFPSLRDTTHLASCSQGAASETLLAALAEFQYTMRRYGAPWGMWMEQIETARTLFAQYIGASSDEVAIVPTASAAAYQVASTQDWSNRPRLVTSDLEFPSIAHIWLAQQTRGVQVVSVPAPDGVIDPQGYADVVDESCGVVSIPWTSFRNGARLPVREVVDIAHRAGARIFVDAYQATGVEPIDVRDVEVDYLTSGSLKYLLGIPGIAFLYVRHGLSDHVPPPNTGWFGRVQPFSFDPTLLDYPADARRFEGGTPSIPSAYGAVAGLRTLGLTTTEATSQHIATLTAHLHEELVSAGERVLSPAAPAHRGPQVALADDDPERLAAFLADRGIVTSPRGDVVRLSFHYYNSADDVEAFLAGLRAYRHSSAGGPPGSV